MDLSEIEGKEIIDKFKMRRIRKKKNINKQNAKECYEILKMLNKPGYYLYVKYMFTNERISVRSDTGKKKKVILNTFYNNVLRYYLETFEQEYTWLKRRTTVNHMKIFLRNYSEKIGLKCKTIVN
jgi:hypothetical protein